MNCNLLSAIAAGTVFVAAASACLAFDQKQMELIQNTAKEICTSVPSTSASVTRIEAEGEVTLQLKGILGRLADAGVGTAAKITTEEYRNISREALAAALESDARCRERIFNVMFSKLTELEQQSSAPQEDLPQFAGRIEYTFPNDRDFLDFIESNANSIVFLDLVLGFEFALSFNEELAYRCNPDFDPLSFSLRDFQIHLPLGDASTPIDDIECADLAFAFSDKDFFRTSAGPGTHMYNLKGFYRVARGPGRWPYLKLSYVEGSAEMWISVEN